MHKPDLPTSAGPAPVLPSLVRFGLSPTADLIYRFLHSQGRCLQSAIARSLGLSAGSVAEQLEALRAAGFVTERGGRTHPAARVWRAVPAAEALASLKTRQGVRRASPGSRFTAVTGADGASIPLGPGVAHLTTRDAAGSRLGALAQVCTHEYLTLTPEQVFEESAMRAAAPTDLTLQSRGVAIRSVGVQPANLGLMAPYGMPVQNRIRYRESPRVSMKLFVVDRRVALIPVDPSEFERGYLEITQPEMVGSLLESFERHWGTAGDPAQRAINMPTLSVRESALLELLIAGHTDVTAARSLQISARSVSTMLRAMMDRFGVQNRFQLGLALGAAHAITLPSSVAGLLASDPPPSDPE